MLTIRQIGRDDKWFVMPSFFRVEQVDGAALPHGHDALTRVHAGALHAVVVRNVLTPGEAAACAAALETNAPGFARTTFPAAFRAFFYGANLNLSPPELDGYFAGEPSFRAALERLPLDGETLEERVTRVLSTLDGGRPYRAAPGPGGARHLFTTLRAHLEGGFIPEHFDNEQAVRPSYRHVAAATQPRIVSFVLAFTRPDGGGAFEFFDIRAEAHGAAFLNHDGPAARRPDLSGVAKASIRLAPGAMLLVDSGGYLHRVTPVEGPRTRWTACSFMAAARSDDCVYCWG